MRPRRGGRRRSPPRRWPRSQSPPGGAPPRDRGEAAGSAQLELEGALPRRGPSIAERDRRSGDSPLQPVVYLVMAFLVAFLARRVGLALVAVAVALDARLAREGRPRGRLPAAIVRAAFVMLFAVLYRAALAQLAAAKRAGVRAAERRRRRSTISRASFASRPPGPGRRRRTATRAGRPRPSWRWRTRCAARSRSPRSRSGATPARCSCWTRRASGSRSRVPLPGDAVARGLSARGALGAAIARRTSVRLHGEIKVATYYEDEAARARCSSCRSSTAAAGTCAASSSRIAGACAVLGRGREARPDALRRDLPGARGGAGDGRHQDHPRREDALLRRHRGAQPDEDAGRGVPRARGGLARDGAGRRRGDDLRRG